MQDAQPKSRVDAHRGKNVKTKPQRNKARTRGKSTRGGTGSRNGCKVMHFHVVFGFPCANSGRGRERVNKCLGLVSWCRHKRGSVEGQTAHGSWPRHNRSDPRIRSPGGCDIVAACARASARPSRQVEDGGGGGGQRRKILRTEKSQMICMAGTPAASWADASDRTPRQKCASSRRASTWAETRSRASLTA